MDLGIFEGHTGLLVVEVAEPPRAYDLSLIPALVCATSPGSVVRRPQMGEEESTFPGGPFGPHHRQASLRQVS